MVYGIFEKICMKAILLGVHTLFTSKSSLKPAAKV